MNYTAEIRSVYTVKTRWSTEAGYRRLRAVGPLARWLQKIDRARLRTAHWCDGFGAGARPFARAPGASRRRGKFDFAVACGRRRRNL